MLARKAEKLRASIVDMAIGVPVSKYSLEQTKRRCEAVAREVGGSVEFGLVDDILTVRYVIDSETREYSLLIREK